MITILSALLILFVTNSSVVLTGAGYGLMLWYRNVLPILLPFMLISSLLVENVRARSNKNKYSAIFITFFLGVLCGYPIGAKTIRDFVDSRLYSKNIGNILLPLCNNASPMFISGYVIYSILCNRISFFKVMLLIYIPLVTVAAFRFLLVKNKTTEFQNKSSVLPEKKDTVKVCLLQITYVCVYIMLCSILTEFIFTLRLPSETKAFLSGITELTRGCAEISASSIDIHKKTALIISITSFGGISSVLQTNSVIKDTELSILQYVIVKLICAIATYLLALLLV